MLLSIIIPVYNEANTIETLLALIAGADLPAGVAREIIIIDDGSTDGTREILKHLDATTTVFLNDLNRGKGYSVRRGLAEAHGDVAVIQDGDLEYDPRDYAKLLEPILKGVANVTYGSRFLKKQGQRWLHFPHRMANRFLTTTSNLFTGLHLTDMETCYKMLSRPVIDAILPNLTSDTYTIEPEITATIAKKGYRIIEVPVSYQSRSFQNGKKIGLKDGLAAIAAIIYFSLIKR